MKSVTFIASLVACSVLSAYAVTPGSSTAAQNAPTAVTPAVKEAVKANNAFANDLYGKLRTRQGNVFFSPLSISTALVMTWEGAGGKTAEDMSRVLHLGKADDARAGFSGLSHRLDASRNGQHMQLRMANRLWGLKAYPYKPEFIARAKGTYGAGFEPVDFARPREASEKINAWVSQETSGRIKDLVPENSLDALTRLVLTNAIYFNGDWARKFDEQATRDGEFRLDLEKKTGARFMHQTGKFHYGEVEIGGESVQVLNMDYLGNASMLVLLPKVGAIETVEKALTPAAIEKAAAAMAQKDVSIRFPRFKISDGVKLNETLKALGMVTAFDIRAADFSGITTREGLFLSAVLHKTEVTVGEKGTEAAAASAVIATLKEDRSPARLETFTADRPFLFFIREPHTGAIIFMGRLSDPSR